MSIAMMIIEMLLKYGPSAAKQAQLLFATKEPTQADWDKLFSLAQEPWVEMKPSEVKTGGNLEPL